ncbi:ZPR1 zinc finger domain-containing protein [Methanosarcina sp.]|uniref:ZPR1 zinc finger domain-containing protein n=1 Tax=Methanosarcina sp. TaxID=2213 RepID=UPI002988676F|nr:ZPR1 zinc finger domain-containing protein [Methanosarcina sp.]MDW5548873.1 ZPR1 zinc finger domain-containing protein [Methanosarcina sp.]MDW5553786.1 ZPR1 zinc finger domain-containing protein [Methanosarcina sp.]MDW5559011.1 ZPR1 zinc finger domain-containing protein [Methanosarcina sp.]
MNPDFLKQERFETKICCPLCQTDLVMNWQRDNIPYFGEIMYISARCQCGFRFADTMILSSKEPMRYEMPVESSEDLDARVIRSTSGTIRIPEMGVTVEPGTVSESYVTNIEGVLQRIRDVLLTASRWVQGDEEKSSRSEELLCMLEDVIEGKRKITVIIEDPLGNSAIISKKAKATTLSEEEAQKLNTGVIIFDVNKSELVNDVSDNVQPLGD